MTLMSEGTHIQTVGEPQGTPVKEDEEGLWEPKWSKKPQEKPQNQLSWVNKGS